MRKLALLCVLALLSVGCGGGDEPSEKGPRSRGSRASAPAKPALCPLTGQPAPEDLEVERPALSVKIENAPVARPQSGLESADIVYEQLAEGGITRFNAIFHCADAEQVGPVRSARFVDAEILVEFPPKKNGGGFTGSVLFAYAGAAPPVQDKVASTEGITDLRHGSNAGAYRRERSRRAPHNLYSSTNALRSLPDAEDVRGAPETGLQFETVPSPSPANTGTAGPATSSPGPAPAPAVAGNEVSFSFGGGTPSRYTYDPSSGMYRRFHGTQPHNTAAGSQIAVANVLVFKVQVRPGTIRDAAGNFSPEITVVGTGDAVILSGGKSVNGKWNRPALSDRTTVSDAAGAPVKLKPGSTWIHLVPASQAVSVK